VLCFGVYPVKHSATYFRLNILESLKPKESKTKARKQFIFPLSFTGSVPVKKFLFVPYLYNIRNRLFPLLACFVSDNRTN
jgi:hypothetical protein